MARADFLPADVTDVHFEVPDREEQTEAQKRADALKDALSEDSEAFVTIHKHPTGSGTTGGEFVDRLPADKYDHGELLIYLKRNYGAGDYRVRLYAKGKLKANTLISIAQQRENSNGEKMPATVGGEVAQVLQQILNPIREQQAQMVEFMRSQNAQPSRAEMLQEMMMYKELFSGGNSGGGDMFKQMRDMMAFMNEMKGETYEGEKEGSGFTEMVKALGPALAAGLQASAAPRQNPVQNYQQNPAPKTAPKPTPNQTGQNPMLIAGFKMLLNAASKNADPAHYSSMIIDALPAEQIKQFIQSKPAFAELLKHGGASAQNYLEWFEDLRQHLLAQFGLPSKYSDLYDDPDGAINGELSTDPEPTSEQPDVSATPD